jgi:hypothetical protein
MEGFLCQLHGVVHGYPPHAANRSCLLLVSGRANPPSCPAETGMESGVGKALGASPAVRTRRPTMCVMIHTHYTAGEGAWKVEDCPIAFRV